MVHPLRAHMNEIGAAAAVAKATEQRRAPAARAVRAARFARVVRAMLGGTALFGAPMVNAQITLPQGGHVAAGSAVIATKGTTTTVAQTSARAIVD
jgi:hypothetical protein